MKTNDINSLIQFNHNIKSITDNLLAYNTAVVSFDEPLR